MSGGEGDSGEEGRSNFKGNLSTAAKTLNVVLL